MPAAKTPHPGQPLDLESLLGPAPSLVGRREDYERIYDNVDADFQKQPVAAPADREATNGTLSPGSTTSSTRSWSSARQQTGKSRASATGDLVPSVPTSPGTLTPKRGRKSVVSLSMNPAASSSSTVLAEGSPDFLNFTTRLSPELAYQFKIQCRRLNGQSMLPDELTMSAFSRALIVLFLTDQSLQDKALQLLSTEC